MTLPCVTCWWSPPAWLLGHASVSVCGVDLCVYCLFLLAVSGFPWCGVEALDLAEEWVALLVGEYEFQAAFNWL